LIRKTLANHASQHCVCTLGVINTKRYAIAVAKLKLGQ
jgi:hypothetical protein